MRRREQPIRQRLHSLLAVRRRSLRKRIRLLRRRQQPGEIEVKPAAKRESIRTRRRLDPRGIEPREDECINRISAQCPVLSAQCSAGTMQLKW